MLQAVQLPIGAQQQLFVIDAATKCVQDALGGDARKEPCVDGTQFWQKVVCLRAFGSAEIIAAQPRKKGLAC
jgi:hypothetical protein